VLCLCLFINQTIRIFIFSFVLTWGSVYLRAWGEGFIAFASVSPCDFYQFRFGSPVRLPKLATQERKLAFGIKGKLPLELYSIENSLKIL